MYKCLKCGLYTVPDHYCDPNRYYDFEEEHSADKLHKDEEMGYSTGRDKKHWTQNLNILDPVWVRFSIKTAQENLYGNISLTIVKPYEARYAGQCPNEDLVYIISITTGERASINKASLFEHRHDAEINMREKLISMYNDLKRNTGINFDN